MIQSPEFIKIFVQKIHLFSGSLDITPTKLQERELWGGVVRKGDMVWRGEGAGRKKGSGQGERRREQGLMHLILSQPAECWKQTDLLKGRSGPHGDVVVLAPGPSAQPQTMALGWRAICILECGNERIRCADVLRNHYIPDGNLSVKSSTNRNGGIRWKEKILGICDFFHCSQPDLC